MRYNGCSGLLSADGVPLYAREQGPYSVQADDGITYRSDGNLWQRDPTVSPVTPAGYDVTGSPAMPPTQSPIPPTGPDTSILAAGYGSECPQVMPANPKQAYGDTKVPLHLFPTTAVALGAMAFLEGREKYGSDNFRAAPIEAMTYIRAALSHIFLYREGEWVPDDSVVPHLGLALASIAILIDAHYAKSLIDNRNFPGGYVEVLKEMQPLVQKIRDQHRKKNPKHYDIRDAKTGGR